MRVLIVSPVFPPEPIVSAQTSAQVAAALVASEHEVTVITAFPSRPAGKLYPGYRQTLYRQERSAAGYNIVRCFSTVSAESRMLSRFAENISFGLTSGWQVLWQKRPDVIYANTWPIFAAGILALVAHLRRILLVISVQDVYPESLSAQGRLSAQSRLARLLRRVDRAIAHSSRSVIVISERFAQLYRDDRGIPVESVHVVPNWGDEGLVVPDQDGAQLRAEAGIREDAFLLVYGGNIGVAAGVEGVIEALGCLPVTSRPHFLVAGAGASLAACRDLAAMSAPGAVSFYTPWPAEKTSPVYAAADALVLPTQGTQSLVSVPSKLIGYMLSARPIIAQAVSGSDLANTIQNAGCGWVVEPNQPQHLAEAIRAAMRLSRAELRELGQAGRAYALSHFTRAVCLPQVMAILEAAARSDRR
jgi:glycosyltransferase involved in cell wall biosynthesis